MKTLSNCLDFILANLQSYTYISDDSDWKKHRARYLKQPKVKPACPCGNMSWSRGLCYKDYQLWYRNRGQYVPRW